MSANEEDFTAYVIVETKSPEQAGLRHRKVPFRLGVQQFLSPGVNAEKTSCQHCASHFTLRVCGFEKCLVSQVSTNLFLMQPHESLQFFSLW